MFSLVQRRGGEGGSFSNGKSIPSGNITYVVWYNWKYEKERGGEGNLYFVA